MRVDGNLYEFNNYININIIILNLEYQLYIPDCLKKLVIYIYLYIFFN